MKFFLPDQDETVEDAREITDKFQPDEDHMASSFAEDVAAYLRREGDYYSDDDWPIDISIIGNGGNFLGTFEVRMEYSPSFYALEKTK